MPRRRLQLSCSSDDEEEDHQQQPEQPPQQQLPEDGDEDEDEDDIEVQLRDSTVGLETVTLTSPNPNPNTNPNPNEPSPVEISDDDFTDASDDPLLPPPQLPQPSPPIPNQSFQAAYVLNSGTSFGESSDCPISDSLRRLGLNLRREWLDSCIRGLESSIPGFGSLDVAAKAKLCFQQFLYSDMNYSGGGILPENVDAMHLVDLAGPFVLQVDEIVNISCPLRGRYQNAPSGIKRCLKLSMTDGVQRVFGMEYRPIKDLEVLAPAGLKVAICNVNVRHGLLMLVPEVCEVLGGLVEELDAARQRLIHEVNKPPRGKRTRNGVLPSLATRATLAAWPTNGGSVLGNSYNSALQDTNSFQDDGQGATFGTSGMDTSERIVEEFAVPISGENADHNPPSNAVLDSEDIHVFAEVEHPFILIGDREIPFTYLASLSAKWVAMKEKAPCVQGTIKCFLTGVKGFQYKQRTTFELRVYVDDGSLISEILIDHNVVQKGIGYSPVEVTAALASSDTKIVGDMRETLKQFQIFLVNFEGTMLVEINGTSPLPTALEIKQGCPASDAWLLLGRLKSSTSQTLEHRRLDPIDISP